jgi:HD-GYP domain-containing protein (c-di-GMP phosphodiesterase class II)
LFFRLWQNASVPGAANIEQRPVGESSIAGYVARSGETVVLDDAYAIAPGAPYVFNPAFDQATGYLTRSLLTVPLTNQAGEVVGVLQLINRKTDPGARLDSAAAVAEFVRPFDSQDRAIAQALAGQAGVALENSRLHAEIERLFEGFIKASVQAIESRDPTTAGHSFRVAGFTERLALAVDRTDQHGLRAVVFSKDQLRELRYAALLHDFGKVGVREHVLVKAKKLHPHELRLLQERFRYARASLERRALRELLALHEHRGLDPDARERGTQQVRAHLAAELARLDRFLKLVVHANEPNVTRQEVSADLDDLIRYRIEEEGGEGLALLAPFEFASLTLAQGSLTAAERDEIESHVTHTYAFLKLIPWTRNLANLPEIAFAHHEKLDGSGYPRRLTPKEIPVQSRMMTIADIYDALTAGDRPYKHGMSAERALDILGAEARAGKVDAPLYAVFVESQAWRSVEAALATDS